MKAAAGKSNCNSTRHGKHAEKSSKNSSNSDTKAYKHVNFTHSQVHACVKPGSKYAKAV